MIDTPTMTTADQPGLSIDGRGGRRARIWRRIALGVIGLISIFLNFYQLGQNGFGNLFYAAGVRSMADSLHNFFFVSYDPGGFVTLDKPPLGFWLQVLSVKIFGFTPFAVFFPQALSGVLAVLVIYILVRRHFGAVAGLLAALALAVSPISVVTNRNNTIDSTLALTMLLGTWAIMKAAETGKWRWLLLSAVAVGLGFNIKMLEAYLVVPAFGLLYLLAAPRTLWMRIGQLAVAALVMLAISLSWALTVDLTPASQRPYVGSSQNNSEISLAIGYNGTQRLLGTFGGGAFSGRNINGDRSRGDRFEGAPGTGNFPDFNGGNTPDFNPGDIPETIRREFADFTGGTGGGGGLFGTGSAGLTRLFNEPLGGQIVWLLPIALCGMLALAWKRRRRSPEEHQQGPLSKVFAPVRQWLSGFQEDREQQSLALWGMWLLTMGIFFSVAGFFHQYYLTVFAPAICALFGIGIVVMWRDYRSSGWRGWLLPIALVLTALEQIHIITSNPAWGLWLVPLISIPTALVAAALAVLRLVPRLRELRLTPRIMACLVSPALIALLLTPAYWSAIPALENTVADLPTAGPQAGTGGRFAGFGGTETTDTRLISYLEANQGKAKYLVAVPSSMQADGIILATNKPVMAMGGFSGSDPILTTSSLQALIANGTVRFFLLSGGGFGGAGGSQESLTSWVQQHCTVVPSSQWQSSSSSTGGFGGAGGNTLYDCASAK
ncbi:MAG TPA: glycosyltransferase family 39 protein [Ktedonobacteraceae bacterium]|nr:glycosyltransferase family 39 protein [Ktedonobacteraceae bacterium]